MAAERIFVSVSTKSRHWSQACDSVDTVVKGALGLIQNGGLVPRNVDDLSTQLLVVDKYSSRIHIVFDICNDSYQPETAHLPSEGNLPVIAVWLSKEERVQRALDGIRDKVNNEVREWHTLDGAGGTPPFIFDRSGGAVPTFVKPQPNH